MISANLAIKVAFADDTSSSAYMIQLLVPFAQSIYCLLSNANNFILCLYQYFYMQLWSLCISAQLLYREYCVLGAEMYGLALFGYALCNILLVVYSHNASLEGGFSFRACYRVDFEELKSFLQTPIRPTLLPTSFPRR
jgi:hypothetical protein